MEYIEIIKNAFHYSISDNNKFFKISAPNILVGLIFGIASLLVLMGMIGSVGYSSYYVTSPMVMVGGMLYFVGAILAIFAAIFDGGAVLTVMGNSIKGSPELPEVAVGEFFVRGLKWIIVTFIYQLIPLIVLALLMMAAAATRSFGFIFIALLIFFVLSFIVSLLLPVAYGKLAETDSIGEALAIGNVWEITSKIGFINVFIMVLLMGIIAGIASSVAYLVALIPVVGPIGAALIGTFIMLLNARVYALIYLEQFGPQTYGISYNQPQTNPNQLNNQQNNQYNNQIQGQPQNQIQGQPQNQIQGQPQNQIQGQPQNQIPNQQDNQIPNQPQNQMDYQPPKENPTNIPSNNTIICPVCGKQNSENFNHCTNCGNNLKQ